MYLCRHYQNLGDFLVPGKALILYGPRRVGKTTLLQRYLERTPFKYRLDSGDNIKTQRVLSSQDFDTILDYISGYELIAIDEAQHIPDIGRGLKIIVDQSPQTRLIATGSSSFELAGQVGEPLTGRKRTLNLYPVAQLELAQVKNPFELKESLEDSLVFGGYPEVITAKTKEEKVERLEEIVNSYLLKDILAFEEVKGSKVLMDLLTLLAFQIGGEVSLSELGQKLGLDYKTVARYLNLFEKAFVLFNLRGFSRNLRKEVTKKSKYFFYDNGVRNAIIANYNGLELRDDQGALWENFLVSERLKAQEYKRIHANNYFWRTYDRKEIDWVEEREGKLFGFEFKWGGKPSKAPKDWLKTYGNAEYQVVNQENYLEFVA